MLQPYVPMPDRSNEDVTGYGLQQAKEFNAVFDSQRQAWAEAGQQLSPELIASDYEKNRQAFSHWLNNQGFNQTQRQQIEAEFNANAYNPYERSWGEVVTDTAKQVGSGAANLAGSALSGLGMDEAADSLWQTADELNQDQSTSIQLQSAAAEQQYQADVASGMNSALAAAKMYKDNPRLIGKLAAEQLPQLGLAAIPMVGGTALVGTNVLAGGGNVRKAVREAWENMPYEDALNHPLMQERLKQGMSFPQALEDVKNDYSDNALNILFGYAIGGAEAATPLAKLGKGINKSVTGTIAKEIGVNALQGGAEQVNQNLAVRSVDGKTNWNDDLGRSMVEEGIGGAAFSPIAGYDAYRNGKAEQINGTQAEQSLNTDEQEIQRAGGGESDNEQVTEAMAPMAEKTFAQVQPQAAQNPQQNANSAFDETAFNKAIESVAEDDRDIFKARLERDIANGNLANRTGNGKYDRFVRDYLALNQVPEVVRQAEQQTEQGEVTPEIQQEPINEPNANNLFAQIKQKITDFVGRVRENKSQQAQVDFMPVSDVAVAEAQEYGLNIAGFSHLIDNSAVNHILNRHSDQNVETSRGQIAVVESDFASIPEVYSSPDKVIYGKKTNRGNDAITYIKKIADGSTLVVEEVRKGKKVLALTTMWKFPSGVRAETIMDSLDLYVRNGADGNGASVVQNPKNRNKPSTIVREIGGMRIEITDTPDTEIPKFNPPKFNPPNPQLAKDRATLERMLGKEIADHVELIDGNQFAQMNRDENLEDLKDVEGFFNPKTGKAYIVADQITARDGLSRDENLAWVVWHELSHKGLAGRYGQNLQRILKNMRDNSLIDRLVTARQAQYNESKNISTEEVIVELSAAMRTGNWDSITERYGVKIPSSFKHADSRLGKALRSFERLFRNILSKVIGRDLTSNDLTLLDLLSTLQNDVRNFAKNSENQTTSDENRYSFAGRNAKTADKSLLGKAIRMDLKGADDETIRKETGWFRGTDRKLRFEIDDSQSKVSLTDSQIREALQQNKHYELDNVFSHPNLFSAYPELRNLTVIFDNSEFGGSFAGDAILIGNTVRTKEELRSLLLHEIQHFIQYEEKFASGGSSLQFEHEGYSPEESYEKYLHLSGEVEARNVQYRKDMSKQEREKTAPFFTQDVHPDDEVVFYEGGSIANSLNENSDSDFARAVDEVANGNRTAQPTIDVGTTPDVLKMLGLPDVNVVISGAVLHKVMHGKHNVTPETLKQLPKQINNPVAVMKSETQANSYVVLTELTERENGKDKPVIAALHLKRSSQGLELINIASVYGRSNAQIQRGLENDLLYWNKEKGAKFLDNLTLQLRSPLSSNSPIGGDIKTEADLSQYQAENSGTRYSRQPQELSQSAYNQAKANGKTELTFQQWKQVRSPEFKRWFGDWENDPENASKVINPRTGEPLVVYHGTNAEFSIFKTEGNKTSTNDVLDAAFFTSDVEYAQDYLFEKGDGKIISSYIVLRNPLENTPTSSQFSDPTYESKIIRQAREKGNDGILFMDKDLGLKFYAVFKPNQIKSATDNNGEFSAENDDIRYSRRPKSESLEKLRKAETIRITGKEIEPSDDLRQYKRNALEYGKSLRGTYVNKDTGRKIELGAGGVKEVLQHDYKNPDHLQSIAAIPQIIEQATYIDTLPNEETDKNFAIDEYEYYVAGLNIGGTDYTVKAVVGVSKDGDRYYDHKLSEIEKGDLLSLPSRITNPVGENNSPLSEIDDKRLLQILQDGNAENPDISDENIRYSRKQSALDMAKAAQIRNHNDTFWQHLTKGDWQAVRKDMGGFAAKLDEWITDGNRPVIDWVMSMKNVSPIIKQKIIGRMQRATAMRDAVVSDLESRYLKPIQQDLAKLANEYFDGDVETTMNKVGFWISARWAVEKNAQLLAREEQAMNEAEQAYNDAIANKEPSNVLDRLERAFIKAENQYYNRKADVESRDFSNDRKYKVGVAGGWSSPLAQEIMRVMEKQIPRSALEAVAEKVYDLNQAQLEYNLKSGRYTQAEYDFYIQDRHYVPLTGTPHKPDGMENDTEVDFFTMPGGKSVNTAKDKSLKGRILSEADNAITAVWESVAKTATYSGWADFKHALNEVYEEQVQAALASGMTPQEAHAEATRLTGISKQKMQGTTRTNDNVLVRKENGQYYEYRIPDEAINALKKSNEEYSNWLIDLVAKPTRWYARGVTQFTGTFAFTNMVRDTWEKSEFIRVQEMYDKNGNPLSAKQKDAIGRALIANTVKFGSIWKATKRYGFGQKLQSSDVDQRYLQELIEQGGLSTHSTYLAKREIDLIKQIEHENRPLAKRMKQAVEAIEGWNAMFDTVSSLSAYKALREAGIDKEQAASITLELTNFRKTGSKLKAVKGLWMFAQPTAMGGRNLAKYLSTKHGQKRFAAYLTLGVVLYSALRGLADDDEGGNKIDQLGDIDRYIPIPSPFEDGKFIKIPVGFGMPQMAWSFATNMVKAGNSDITIAEAATNMFMHTVKATVPVSPSEISAAKYPLEKAAMTATPSIFQPLMQIALNRNAFGSQITTGFVSDKKLKAEQAKANTAPFWKETALWLSDMRIADMHPEQLKALWDGYSGMLGSLREVMTVMVENPNRERLGKNQRVPLLNTFYGAGNEFAISSRFYEAVNEARDLHNHYTSRKERGTLPSDWLTPERKAIIQWMERTDKETQEIRSRKAKATKAYNAGKMGEVAYQNEVNKYDKMMDTVQRRNLHKWRRMQGLNTSESLN